MRRYAGVVLVAGLAAVATLVLGCGGGGGSSGPARDDTKVAGTFTMAMVGMEPGATHWNAWPGYSGLEFDGAGTVNRDDDLDGSYDEGSQPYSVYVDGTMVVGGTCKGILNAAEDTAVLTDSEVSTSDELNLVMAIRDSTGMTVADFNGDYISCQFGIDTSDGSHWTTRLAITGNGNGTANWAILSDSGSGSGSGIINYTTEDSGRFTQTSDDEYGMLRSDGAVWFLTDEDVSNDNIHLMVSVKKGTGLDESILNGTYILAQLRGQDDGAGNTDFSTARISITADGAGNVSYKVLSDSSGGTGETGNSTYTVDADGALAIEGIGDGIVSSDGSIFVVADTDWDGSSDDEVSMMIGIKEQ